MSRDISFYIVDIFVAIDKIKRYCASIGSADELLGNELVWDACIRELEIIGEATKYLLQAQVVAPSYRRIVDFRNQISHGYFGINEEIVWDVIENKMPFYENDLFRMVDEQDIDIKEAIKLMQKETKQTETIHYLNRLLKSVSTTKP